MTVQYPSSYEGDFSTFEPPKKLCKSSKEDFKRWFEEYNHMEVLRYVFIASFNDMLLLLSFLGGEFTDEEIQGYLSHFGNDKGFQDFQYAKFKFGQYLDEWFEFAGTVKFIDDALIMFAEDEDC
jgi:hypothetical protein